MQNKINKQKACPQCLKHSFCRRGFTIIETMISVSLFIVVIMAGMGALLNANLLQQKSQNMRSIIDNLSFIMEDMSRNLRTGYDYHCFITGDTISPSPSSDFTASIPKSCPDGDGGGIAFEQQDGQPYEYSPNSKINIEDHHVDDQWVYYIGSCNGGNSGICKSTKGGASGSYVQLVPDEVDINNNIIAGVQVSGFSVSGAESPRAVPMNDFKQPFVTIKLVGTINVKNVITPFSLQTSVSQRRMDR